MENKNLNNKIKTFELDNYTFGRIDGNRGNVDVESKLRNMPEKFNNLDNLIKNADNYLNKLNNNNKENFQNFEITNQTVPTDFFAYKKYTEEKQLNLDGWYPEVNIHRDIRNLDTENNLKIQPSRLNGKYNAGSELTPAYNRIVDISTTLTFNPNNQTNSVMNDIPRGGFSSRYLQ